MPVTPDRPDPSPSTVTGSTDDPRSDVPPLTAEDLREPLVDLTTLACRGVPGCDAASVTVRLGEGFETTAASNEVAREMDRIQYDHGDGPCVRSLEHGEVVDVRDYRTEQRWPQCRAAAVAHGVGSSLSLPLRDGARVLGALNLYADERSAFGGPSHHVADVLVRQATAAVRYLELLRVERQRAVVHGQIAATLQRSLLPSIPELPGMTCAARYLVSTQYSQVGGDWYDVFALPDGTVGLALGDVMGHDVEAAAAMGQLRSVLRSYAYEGGNPSTVLDRLDRLVQGFGMAQIATAVYGRLVLDRGGAMLLYCNAGHPPPLVRLPDRSIRRLEGATSRLIGVAELGLPPRTESAVLLPAGSTLLLYTDGLVEHKGGDVTEGIDRLAGALAAHRPGTGPDELCDRLLETMLPHGHDDDVALLAVRID